MLKRYTILTVLSLAVGVVTHVTFYPILERWNNDRMRSFAKFGIGVCVGLLVFLGWFRENQRVFITEDNRQIEKLSILAVLSYMVAYVIYGSGVVLGYILGDLFGYPQEKNNGNS